MRLPDQDLCPPDDVHAPLRGDEALALQVVEESGRRGAPKVGSGHVADGIGLVLRPDYIRDDADTQQPVVVGSGDILHVADAERVELL